MATKQTIAIIGASGNMGSAIAKSLAGGSYRLLLMGRNQEKLSAVKKEIEAIFPTASVDVIACPKDASWEADIIISAVDYMATKEIAELIREVATQKIVISISNPLNAQFDGLVTMPGVSAAEELQKLLPYSKVVKAFNTNFLSNFSQPVLEGKTVDSFLAGNDAEALGIVSNMVEQAGFNPIIAGDLSASQTLEAMQLLLIKLNMNGQFNWQAGWKILHN